MVGSGDSARNWPRVNYLLLWRGRRHRKKSSLWTKQTGKSRTLSSGFAYCFVICAYKEDSTDQCEAENV